MNRAALAGIALLAFSFGGVSAQTHEPHTQSVKAAGVYDVQVDIHGQSQSTVLTIAPDKEGRLGGTLSVHGEEFKLENVTLRGHDMIVRATLPHGALTLTLSFKSADELAGTLEMEGLGSGTAAGTRRKA
jgi:hypothetical protein